MATSASCSSSPALAPTRASSPRQRLTEHRLTQQLLLDFQHHSASKGHSGPESSPSEEKTDISDEGTFVDELDSASMTNSTSSLLCLPKQHHHHQHQQLASLTNTLLAGGVALVSPVAAREYHHASLESIQELREDSKLRSPKAQGAAGSWTLHANQSICPSDQGNHAHNRSRANHRHSRSQQIQIHSPDQGQLQRQRPSTSSGASTLSSGRNRVIFAPTVRIGSRPVPRVSSKAIPDAEKLESSQPQALSTPSQKEQFDAAAAAFSHRGTRRSASLQISRRRPKTTPQEQDAKFDEDREASVPRRLLSPVSWKSFASNSPNPASKPPHSAAGERPLVGFPDGFVSAPLHPAGPLGGDLPSNTPAISPALPEDLPPPPRRFVPGTLILARDESLWTDAPCRNDEEFRDTNPQMSTHLLPSLSGQLTRRQTLPIEAALPSEPSSPEPGSNDNSEESPASLRLLDSRLDEVVSRGRAQTGASHQILPSADRNAHTPESQTQIQEQVVLWHGEAPSDPPSIQKRQIPFRAIAVAARAMKRFFHSRKPSENSEGINVSRSATVSKHRRRQSVMHEVLHGSQATEDEEEEAEIEQWAIQQCEVVAEPGVRSPPPAGRLSEPFSLAVPDDGSTQRRSSAPDLGHRSPNTVTPARRASEPTTKTTPSNTTPVRIVVSPRLPHASTPTSRLSRDGSLTPSWLPGRLVSKRPSTAPDTEGLSSMAHLPPTPASILVVGPSDIETRATPWEFGTPNVTTPAYEMEEPQLSEDNDLYFTATHGETEGRTSQQIARPLSSPSKQIDIVHVSADAEPQDEDPDKITVLRE